MKLSSSPKMNSEISVLDFKNDLVGGVVFCLTKMMTKELEFRNSFIDEIAKIKESFPVCVTPGLGIGDLEALKKRY